MEFKMQRFQVLKLFAQFSRTFFKLKAIYSCYSWHEDEMDDRLQADQRGHRGNHAHIYHSTQASRQKIIYVHCTVARDTALSGLGFQFQTLNLTFLFNRNRSVFE